MALFLFVSHPSQNLFWTPINPPLARKGN